MSSPLDARMRSIAHEVASEFADGLPGSNDRTAALEKQIAELAERVEALEKAPRRAATQRKGTGE